MSGRFVSAGTAEEPPERDDEWLKAQQELEANSRRKKEEGSGVQDGGKSLYEVLQANKAAKQEAYEESIRLKNQFRSLDEDEVDFLDSVLESTRAKDEAVRKETTEQLDAFRRQQEEAEKAARVEDADEAVVEEEQQWQINPKKRKKTKDSETTKGLKLRRTSSAAAAAAAAIQASPDSDKKNLPPSTKSPAVSQDKATRNPSTADGLDSKAKAPSKGETAKVDLKLASPSPTAGLGLVDYSSDDE